MKKIEEIILSKHVTDQQKALINIRYTSNYLIQIQNNFMEEFNLTMPQFNVLRILRGNKTALTVHDIKERMVEKSPNTTRLLDKLEDKQYIERNNLSLKDKRKFFVSITELGLAILTKIDDKIEESSFFKTNLTDEEANTLSNLLDKLRTNYTDEK